MFTVLIDSNAGIQKLLAEIQKILAKRRKKFLNGHVSLTKFHVNQKFVSEIQHVFSMFTVLIDSNAGIQKLLAEIQKILAKRRKKFLNGHISLAKFNEVQKFVSEIQHVFSE